MAQYLGMIRGGGLCLKIMVQKKSNPTESSLLHKTGINKAASPSYTHFKHLIISLILVVGLLPGFFGLISIYNISKKELIASKGLYFMQVAVFTAYQIESRLEEKLAAIERLTLLPTIQNILILPQKKAKIESANFRKIIEPEMAGKGIIFNIYNTMGETVFSSEITYLYMDIGKMINIEKIANTNQRYISDVTEFISDGQPPKEHHYLEIYAPILDGDGKSIGSIVARYIVDQLFDTINNVRIGRTGHANLVVSSGNILVCPIFPPNSHETGADLLKTIMTKKPGWAMVNDDAHGSSGSLIGFAPINLKKEGLNPDSFGKKEWFIFVRQEPYETFESLKEFQQTSFAYAGGLILLVVVLGFFARRQILKAQKAHETEVVQREKSESIKQLIACFQQLMFNPLEELGKWIDDMEKREKNNKQDLKKLGKIKQNLKSLDSLTEHLMYYTRTSHIRFKPVELSKVVDESLLMLGYLIEKDNIAVDFNKKSAPIAIMGEERLLNIVMLNIILNALQAVGEKGKITVSLEKNNAIVMCRIVDNGRGIPKDEIGDIFDPFFTTKKGRKGYGLGLSASKGIVEEHGGEIMVWSDEDKGTEVLLKFRLAESNS